jgi:hypothetical protein
MAFEPDASSDISIDICATSPETRNRPPRFFAGSVTRTGKDFTDAGKENMGLKNKSDDFPQTPSRN